ncbi:hypothetical protein JEZ99_32335 [Pseudomonas aeruginosa]|nr:hypothetical protein [Pseudomonas aeruginosa]
MSWVVVVYCLGWVGVQRNADVIAAILNNDPGLTAGDHHAANVSWNSVLLANVLQRLSV